MNTVTNKNMCNDDLPHRYDPHTGACTGPDCFKDQEARYTIFIEPEQFPDPEKFPDGIAWSSGILDENGELIDGGGDIATYEEAKTLALSTLERLLEWNYLHAEWCNVCEKDTPHNIKRECLICK